VHASYDPTTLAHVHELQSNAPEGAVAHVQSAFDDPRKILRGAAATLDLGEPVGVLLPTTLNLIPDDAVARRIVDGLLDAVVAGSHVVMAHTSLDIFAEGTAEVIELMNQALDEPYVSRSEDQIAGLLRGLDLLDPGLVPLEQWRSDGDPPVLPHGQLVPMFGAVGRKD
jgi:hypothetical protein